MKTNMINTNSVIKSICAVVMLLGISVSAWGAKTGTLNMNSAVSTGTTNNGVTFTWSSTNIEVNTTNNGFKASSNMTITIPSGMMLTGISKVNGNTWGGGATISVYTGSDNTGTKLKDIVSETDSYSISSNNTGTTYYFENSTSKNAWINSLSITYANASACYVMYDPAGGTCATEDATEESVGAGVVLPEATPSPSMASMGWGFYGWAEDPVDDPTTTAPTIIGKAGDTYYPDEDVIVYAVYAKGTYTKVTSTSEITVDSGEKYLIAGLDDRDDSDPSNDKMYIMTHESYIDKDDYENLYGAEMGSSAEDTYSAADIHADWRYSFSKSTTYYYFQNIATSKYVDTDNSAYIIYTATKTNSHKYTITFIGTDGYCKIQNYSNSNSFPYLVVWDEGAGFGANGTAWEKMLIYKETVTPIYCSNPKTVKVVASPAAGGTVTIEDEESYAFSGASVEDITASAAANSGYDFLRWESSGSTAKFYNQSTKEYDLSSTTEDEEFVKATGDATLTAYFYQNHSITYTLSAGVAGEVGNPTTVTKTEKDGFLVGFNLQAHYKDMTLVSVTMGGSPMTEGEEADYEWEVDDGTAMLTIHHANIDGDIVITVSATHMEYTKYAFSCSELTLTPHLATTGTPIFITSTASKTVRSQDYIEITGNGLTPSTALTFPSLPSQFAIKNADGTAVTTDVNGEISSNAYIFYTPDAGDTEDGLDKLTGITVSVGGAKPKTVVLTQDIIGRHLPADFVIAAKKDGKWYALPSDMESTSTPAPSEIAVDDIYNPSIAYTAASNIYGLAGPTASNISGGNGQYIRLTMSIEDGNDPAGPAPLFGTATSNIGKSGNSKATSDLSAGNWWSLTQTNTSISNPQDAKYIVKCANNSNALKLYKTSNVWGQYAYGADVAISELRLIPASSVVFTEAEIVAWGQHNAIVEVDRANAGGTGVAAAKVKAKLNGEESSLITLTETGTSKGSATKYDYTVAFGNVIDFAANEGQMLTLEWYNSSDVMIAVSNIIVPRVIATTNTMYTISTNDPGWNTEVHVLPGVTLTADAGSFPSSDVSIKELNIYPGATVKVTTGTLQATTLVMRNGWDRLNGDKKYDVARLQIKTTANLTHTNAYLDWYIDNDQYYPLAVPFPVTVSGIHYLNTNRAMTIGGYDGTIRLRYYDGANRAEGKMGNWKYYGVDGSLAVPETLVPSMGYAMAAKRPGGKAFSIVRMPMTFDNAWTALGEHGSAIVDATPLRKDTVHVYAYGNAKTAENNKGWNLIGNPYMAVFHGDDNEAGIYGKLLAVTNKDDEKAEKVRYVTIPNSSFTDYEQVNFKDTLLQPSSSFLIQAKDTCRLEFSSSKIDIPSAPARYTATPTAASEQEAYIRLTGAGEKDQMGLIIGEDYTAAYETNADLAKMHGELNTLKTYMVYDSVDMAYLAINEELAKEWIPVVARIPNDGEYTYSLRTTSVVNELEGIYLIDYQTNTVTNLIEQSYTFSSTAGTINGRFAINAKAGERQTPTGIDAINAGGDINSDKPFKFIYHDKVYIWINGVIYDTTGKRVK